MNLVFRKVLHHQPAYIIAAFSYLHLLPEMHRNRVYESKESETLFNPTSSRYRNTYSTFPVASGHGYGTLRRRRSLIVEPERSMARPRYLLKKTSLYRVIIFFTVTSTPLPSSALETWKEAQSYCNITTLQKEAQDGLTSRPVHFPMNAQSTSLDIHNVQ